MRPETEDQLADILRGANGPLSLRGGATRHVPGAGEALTTSAMTGITLYEPGAMTIVARAGTTMAELEAALAEENQRLPFEPMDHRALLGTDGVPTIGGAVAMNVSGPRRITVGACRDSLIGVRFVDGTGAVVKNGGRVMKNVTGYDLVKLLAGSRGRLGVLSEVSLRVLPATAARATIRLSGLGISDAVAAMSAALGSPFEVNGAAHVANGDPVTLLRIEGLEASVTYRAGELRKLLSRFGIVEVEMDGSDTAAWDAVRDATMFAGTDEDVWRIHCRPSHAADLVARLDTTRVMLDWGGGLIWAGLPAGTDARARLGAFAGHATRVRGPGPGAEQPEAPALAALTDGIRARFDPRGLFEVT
ncbi:FAD-binding protein [Jannaschia sp. 2305UL9-9]|uniref:FAD-binding protein n=1 Tax=Jannaschia sp. 2305UL9-9 TaxID=3121638 RepID=UPI003529A10C